MGVAMNEDELIMLTKNLISDYLEDGEVSGLAMLLAEDVVAYSHLHVNYVRGSWNVRQFLYPTSSTRQSWKLMR